MKKYKVRIRRKNGTKIELEADAVSVSGNRIGFHRDGEPTLWTKIDNVEVDRVVMVWMYYMKILIFGQLFH